MTAGSGSFPKEHRHFFKNIRKYNFQNLKAIQRPCRGVRASAGKLWPQPLPTPLIPIHAITLEGRSDRVQNMWRGWLNETLEGEKRN